MKQVLNAVATLLMRAAHGRAEQVMHMQAQARSKAAEDYRANAGGWN
ncbi:hypothetical protein [Massilia niabensis]|uniref:Uncharacterized protein n=1 Tax=Massilia niabensis TaxID=544910 RepID=A0ABW0L7L3_9BURK